MKHIKKSTYLPTIVACLIIQSCLGIIYLWSAFRSDIEKSFNWDVKSSSMVASVMLLAFVLGNLLGGILNDKKGPKVTVIFGVALFSIGVGTTGLLNSDTINWIFITYCIIGGLGAGAGYIACISCILKWLPHKLGLASGLAAASFGLSTVIFAPIVNLLIDWFRNSDTGIVNFKMVFLILAVLFFVISIIATIFVKLPTKDYLNSLPEMDESRNMPASREFPLKDAVKTARFWWIVFFLFFVSGTWNLSVPLIKGLGMARGLSEGAAIFALSFTGIANAAGRFSVAFISDKIGRLNAYLFISCITLAGAVVMLFANGPLYIVVIAAIAFAYGGQAAVNAATVTDFFGPKNSGTNYGVVLIALGISGIVFNWIASNILNGDVQATFIMGAITAFASGIFMFLMKRQRVIDQARLNNAQ